MKSIMWVVGWGLVSSVAFAAPQAGQLPSGGEIPEITNVSIEQDQGRAVVRFEVETIGACEVFTTQIDSGTEGETYLTVVKQSVPNCTRPQHEPRVEAKTLTLADDLRGPVRLGNPIIVETHFRQ